MIFPAVPPGQSADPRAGDRSSPRSGRSTRLPMSVVCVNWAGGNRPLATTYLRDRKADDQGCCTGVLADDRSLLVCSHARPRLLDAVSVLQVPRLLSVPTTIAITASRESHHTGSCGRVRSSAVKGAQRPAVICLGDERARRRRCSTAVSCGPTHAVSGRGGHQQIGRAA